jgi:hypothetical protein
MARFPARLAGLFLDTRVLLTACASTSGASHDIFRLAPDYYWILITTPYVIGEVLNNLTEFPASASAQWAKSRGDLLLFDDVLVLDRAAICPAGKDRLILFSTLVWTDVFLCRETTGILVSR